MASANYLLVIGDREALGWVLAQQRTAFPDARRLEVAALNVGDRLFIYTTRGCFKNPVRHRGRVIGEATVTSIAHQLPEPMIFSDRRFPIGCDLQIDKVAPLHQGIELAQLTAELEVFAGAGDTWAIRLRRTLVPLSSRDASTLRTRLRRVVKSLDQDLERYAHWYRERVS